MSDSRRPFARAAIIARFKPVHLGHAAVLEGLAAVAHEAVVGIGSSNRYNPRNPFTTAETAAMIGMVVAGSDNMKLLEVPDFDDGPRWRDMVVDLLGPLDAFFTANPYVRDLLAGHYRVLHPVTLVAPEKRRRVSGTMVRRAMARGEGWRELVPPAVAAYLEEHALVDRFRREFGPATLAPGEPEE